MKKKKEEKKEIEFRDYDILIINHFLRNGNTSEIKKQIAASIKSPKDNERAGNETSVGNRCEQLQKWGVLKKDYQDVNIQGRDKFYTYCLDSTIEALKIIAPQLPDKDVAKVMTTSYYNELFPQVVKHFEEAIEKQNIGKQRLKPLTDFEKEFVEKTLKCSPRCLNFVFREKDYKRVTVSSREIVLQQLTTLTSIPANRIRKNPVFKPFLEEFVLDKIWIYVFSILENMDFFDGVIKSNVQCTIKWPGSVTIKDIVSKILEDERFVDGFLTNLSQSARDNILRGLQK